MKNFASYLAAVFLAFLFVSCGEKGGENAASGNSIDGEWTIVSAEGSSADMNVGTVYTFKDGKMSTSKGSITSTGSYTLEGNSLKWKVNDNDNFVMSYTAEVKGGKLIISPENSGQTFTLEKK